MHKGIKQIKRHHGRTSYYKRRNEGGLYTTLLPQLKSLIEGENDTSPIWRIFSVHHGHLHSGGWLYRVIDGTLCWVLSKDRLHPHQTGRGACGTLGLSGGVVEVREISGAHCLQQRPSRSEIVVPVIRTVRSSPYWILTVNTSAPSMILIRIGWRR